MALFQMIRNQFIEVIEWTDNSQNTLVYKFPVRGSNIKMGAQLTVRESQAAVFLNEGTVADMFTPGRYELSTQNMPVMTALNSWKFGFNSPFKADVFFVNTRQFTDQKWGTMNPVMMRDSELGVLRLRGFGSLSYRVSDPVVFLKEIFGTSASFETGDIANHLKSLVVSALTDYLAEMQVPAFDLARYYDEIGEGVRKKVGGRFDAIGLKLTAVLVENLSLPPEVEKVLDQRTSMGVIGGGIQQYAQYQSVEAIRDAARNPGGMAGAGAGIGAGAAIGKMMSDALNSPAVQAPQPTQATQAAQPTQMSQPTQNPRPAEGARFCQGCGAALSPGARFCPQCGEPIG
ncbi:MAG: SPFH domain-containing protein [Clostridiales bacterium]|jgi:membrane protease subunit (stomatin/prohibitin family)|nr:SPFH domain-containing protein [Clostridiales bacterium]